MRYKDKYARFRLAGRFMQLYDGLVDQDLRLYIDLMYSFFKVVLNF